MHIAFALRVALALGVITAAPGGSQFGIFAKDKGKESKEQKERERDVKRVAREATRYEKLKEFSVNLYENDIEFREAVDDHFEGVLRVHSERAFNTNVSRHSSTVAIHEDRFRQHQSLYDNLVIQDYVNRLGQRMVPPDSDKLFAFRLTPHPIPYAETLATGTIYISTGLVAGLESEAQLAYVLGHEMAHVYLDHWRLKSKLAMGEPEYNAKQERKRGWWSLIGAGAGAALGGAIGGRDQIATGAAVGLGAGYLTGALLNRKMDLDWDKVQEDEADKLAFKIALGADYDVREVPKLYVALQNHATRDSRIGLGFIGHRKRVRERLENCKDLIEKAYQAEIDMKMKEGKLVGDNPQFRHLMAELKRDNGILAFYYDMFELARTNLADAVAIRSNDPAAHYYYGKVLKLIGRTPEDRKLADQSFVLSAKYDTRGQNFGAHLHHALSMLEERTEANQKLIVNELQSYVNTYLTFAVNNARGARLLPPNLDTIYEYMSLLGETSWMPKLPDDAPMFLEANAPKIESPAQSPLTPAAAVTPASTPAPQPQAPAPAKRSLIPLIPRKP